MDRACGGSCHVLDVQLPIYEVDFWVDIEGLSDAELCLLCTSRRHCCALGGWWNSNNPVKCSKITLGYMNIQRVLLEFSLGKLACEVPQYNH